MEAGESLLEAGGDLEDAIRTLGEAFQASVDAFGVQHPFTARCQRSLARAAARLGRYEEAQLLLRHAEKSLSEAAAAREQELTWTRSLLARAQAEEALPPTGGERDRLEELVQRGLARAKELAKQGSLSLALPGGGSVRSWGSGSQQAHGVASIEHRLVPKFQGLRGPRRDISHPAPSRSRPGSPDAKDPVLV